MIKRIVIYLLFLFLFPACFRLIPKKYFTNYQAELNRSKKSDQNLISSVYQHASIYRTTDTSTNYLFFYSNNTVASINVPCLFKGKWINNKNQLDSCIKSNIPLNYSWTYYSITKDTGTIYDLDYLGYGQKIITNTAKISRENFKLFNDSLKIISIENTNSKIKFREFCYSKIKQSLKPDSSKSVFLCRFTNFLRNGYRRYD